MTTHGPVEFPLPPDFQGFAQWDKMHCPKVQTPMSQDVFSRGVSKGFTMAMDEFACPIGVSYVAYNYYAYMATPLQASVQGGREPFEARMARYGQTIETVVPRIGRMWTDEWLPAILPGIEKTRTQDYGAMSDAELLAAFDEAYERFVERYVVHGKINFNLISASRFADFYNDSFKPADQTEPYEVLQGFPTKSLDAGRGLWQLSRTVKASPALMKTFEETDTRDLPRKLEQTDEGRRFLSALGTYLDEFGWRSDVFELADLTWRENPVIPLNALQGYIYLADDADPDTRFRQSVERREQLLAQARARLANDAEKLAEFERRYEAAKGYLNVTEDHNYYIDQIGNTVMRLPLLEAGRRLVARGLINEVDDIFSLHVAEMREALLQGHDFRSLTTERKAEMERWAQVVPPPILGTPPPPSGDPLEDGIIRMFGMPPEPSSDPSVIQGLPASAGTVRGRAKVVRTLSEASKLEKGDIMVCEMTMPPWTPLFSTVSAVVADTGGILSHCAIVSREYRLPCVVGTAIGTAVIKDGMMLTVDGSRGIVRIDAV